LKANLGIEKNSAQFYQAIVEKLAIIPSDITMIGDSLEKDIVSALEAGLNAIWFNSAKYISTSHQHFRQIASLTQLIGKPDARLHAATAK
jgi:putative hydrolase of the HAD superfamily